MLLSWNFLELGAQVLSQASTWLVGVALRTNMYAQSEHGWSMFFKRYLAKMLFGPSGFATGGVSVPLACGARCIYARFGTVLADGDGHRMTWQWRGASGLKPCMLHYNVWKKGSDAAWRDDGGVEITCADYGKFKCWSTAKFEAAIDMLLEAKRQVARRELTQQSYTTLTSAYGFAPSEEGVLADLRLRPYVKPMLQMQYDWVHSVLQDGLLSVDAWQILKSLHDKDRQSFKKLDAHFTSGWEWPYDASRRGMSKHVLKSAFSQSSVNAARDADRLKTPASSMLLVYSLLRHYILDDNGGAQATALELASFEAACRCVDILLLTKRGILTCREASPKLQEAVKSHLEAHIRAYGCDSVKPKHHWLADIAEGSWRVPAIRAPQHVGLHSFMPCAARIALCCPHAFERVR